jgi:hypothetical protein
MQHNYGRDESGTGNFEASSERAAGASLGSVAVFDGCGAYSGPTAGAEADTEVLLLSLSCGLSGFFSIA